MSAPSDSTNPYEPPKSGLFDEASASDRAELIAYMSGEEPTGSAAEYYQAQLGRYLAGQRPRVHLAALVLGSVWCFWRKLYLVGAILYVAELLASILIYLVAAAILPEGESSPLLPWLGFLALLPVRVPFAFLANRFYLRAAARAAAKVRARGMSGTRALEGLRRQGGTSGLGAGVAILINLVFRALDRLAA